MIQQPVSLVKPYFQVGSVNGNPVAHSQLMQGLFATGRITKQHSDASYGRRTLGPPGWRISHRLTVRARSPNGLGDCVNDLFVGNDLCEQRGYRQGDRSGLPTAKFRQNECMLNSVDL